MPAVKPYPTKHTGLLEASWTCMTCGKEDYSKNAMGVAARHARASGHTVHATSTVIVIYNKR